MSSARIMGMGKPHRRLYTLKRRVFRRRRKKSGAAKKILKYLKPTQGLLKRPTMAL